MKGFNTFLAIALSFLLLLTGGPLAAFAAIEYDTQGQASLVDSTLPGETVETIPDEWVETTLPDSWFEAEPSEGEAPIEGYEGSALPEIGQEVRETVNNSTTGINNAVTLPTYDIPSENVDIGTISEPSSYGTVINNVYGEPETILPEIPEYDEYYYYYDEKYEEYEEVVFDLSFSGLVVSSINESALAGAVVSLVYGDQVIVSVQTDSQGIYYIPEMSFDSETLYEWTIRVVFDGYKAAYALIEDYINEESVEYNNITIDFYLEAEEAAWDGTVIISGVVTSYGYDTPLEGAAVELASNAGIFAALTDENGFYEILILPEGEEVLDINAVLLDSELTASLEGFLANTVNVDDYILYVDEFGRLAIYFALQPEVYIPEGYALVYGVVTLEETPVYGATVEFTLGTLESWEIEEYPTVFVATTDAEGKYSILLPALDGTSYVAWARYTLEEYVPQLDEYGDVQFDVYGNKILEKTERIAVSEPVELELVCGDMVELNFELEWIGIQPMLIHEINNADQLAQFLAGTLMGAANNHTFVLTANIDMAAFPDLHGRGFAMGMPFTGTFDGDGHTISNLTLRPRNNTEAESGAHLAGNPDFNDFGFIRVAGDGAVIENLTFSNLRIQDVINVPGAAAGTANPHINWNTATGNMGLVIGRTMDGSAVTLENVNITSTGTTATTRSQIEFTRGTAATEQVRNKRVGGMVGLVGANSTLNITDTTTVNFTVTGNQAASWLHSVGGMVGQSEGHVNVSGQNTTVNMTTAGTIRNLHLGGVIGRIVGSASTANIQDITVSGTINARESGTGVGAHGAAGGIIGSSAATIANAVTVNNATVNAVVSMPTGDINAANAVGGIVGIMGSGSITDATISNNTDGGRDLGGAVGRVAGTVTINNFSTTGGSFGPGTATAAAGATRGVGGVVGLVATTGNVTINGTTNTRAFTVPRGHGGGIVGRNMGAVTLRNVHNTAIITAGTANNEGVGGILGYSRNANIQNSTNTATVNGRVAAGGIIGWTSTVAGTNTTLIDVTNTGTIQRTAVNGDAGGLIGFARCATTYIRDSRNEGLITATGGNATATANTLGGLIGRTARSTYIHDSQNTGAVTLSMTRAHRVGGIVGFFEGRGAITNTTNYATITMAPAGGTAANRRDRARNPQMNAGGIIGRVTLNAGNRTLDLTNVENRGNIATGGTTSHPIIHTAGGIVGIATHPSGAAPTLRITDATNIGNVRGLWFAGGIIANAQQANVIISQSINYGNIIAGSGTTSHTTAARRNNVAYGGIIGRVQRGNTQIFQSANMGAVFHPGTQANGTTALSSGNMASGTGAGMGGIVGDVRSTAGRIYIQESFNTGYVFGHRLNGVGGIVGRKHGGSVLIIQDVYNTGGVSARETSAVALRRGNGILGRFTGLAAAGSVQMRNVYNAGNVRGRAIFGEDRADGRIRRVTFQNVYFDSTMHTGLPQVMAAGISAETTSDLTRAEYGTTRPIFSGLNNGSVWMTGTRRSLGGGEYEHVTNTLPYLRWQTGGVLERYFVSDIKEGGASVLDLPGSGTRAIQITNIAHDPDTSTGAPWTRFGTRIFNPYVTRPSAINNTGNVMRHVPTTSAHQIINQARDGMMSIGVMSNNGVIAFDIDDRPNVLIIFAYDYDDRDERISFSHFTRNGDPYSRGMVTYALPTEGSIFDATALGYAPGQYTVTLEDVHLVYSGDVVRRIYMQRIPFGAIRVEIRNGSLEAEPLIANAALRHNTVPQTALGGTDRHFMLDPVHWRDTLFATAQFFYPGTLSLTYYDLIWPDGHVPGIYEGIPVVRMLLEDLDPRNLQVRLYEVTEGDEDDILTRLFHRGGSGAGMTQGYPYTPEYILYYAQLNSPFYTLAGLPTGTTSHLFLQNAIDLTEIQVWALGFRTSEIHQIGDILRYDDDDNRLTFVHVYMERVANIGVRVYERIVMPDDTYFYRLVNTATLDACDDFHNVTNNNNGTFVVNGMADGETFTVNAPGFMEYERSISFEYDNVSLGTNTALSTGNVSIILERELVGGLIGFVREAGTNDGIENATVTVFSESGTIVETTTSGLNGFFEVTPLDAGHFVVFGSHSDFSSNVSTPNPVLVMGEVAVANIYLTPGTGNQYMLFVRLVCEVTGNSIDPADATVQFSSTQLTAPDAGYVFAHQLNSPSTGLLTGTAPGFSLEQYNVTNATWGTNNFAFVTLSLRQEVRDFVVYVRDALGNNLTGARLHRNTDTEITGNNTGRFTIPVAHVNDILTGSAPGFVSVNSPISGQDAERGSKVINLTELAPVNNLTVEVRRGSVTGEIIDTATLVLLDNLTATITRNNNGTFTVNGVYIHDVFTAAARGFTSRQHTVTAADVANGTVVIVLGAGTDPFQPETVTVNVRNSAGVLIPTASLTLDGVAVTAPTPATGQFTLTLDGSNIEDELRAIAPGFSANTHSVTTQDLHNREITITLTGNVEVEIEVTVVDAINAPDVPFIFSSLTHSTNAAMTGGNGVWLVTVTGDMIGTVLTGSGAGFAPVPRPITAHDLADPRKITIELGGAWPVDVIVNVEDSDGNRLPTADLEHATATINPAGIGRFYTNVTGALVNTNFVASADGFVTVNHPITTQDLYNGEITIVLGRDGGGYTPVDVTVNVVSRINGVEAPLPTAMLTFEGATQGPASTFTLSLDGSDIGEDISVVAAGFTANTHSIVAEDLALPRTITIVLGEHPGTGFEPVNLTVTVADSANPGTPLTSSTLEHGTLTVGGSAGSFTITVTGAYIGTNLTARADGFATRNVPITPEHLRAENAVILLDEGYAVPVTVNVVDSAGRPVPTATLTHLSADIIELGNGVFTAYLTSRAINTNLIANADGFNPVSHTVTSANITARTITITLGSEGYDPVDVTVNVVSRINGVEAPLPTAMLTFGGAVQGPASTFTLSLNGSNIEQLISVEAPGFTANAHAIKADDLAAPRVITIVLGEYPGTGFEPVSVTVRVESSEALGVPLESAGITPPAGVTPNVVEPGVWTVTLYGHHAGQSIVAGASGFNSQSRPISTADLAAGNILFVLEPGDAILVTIRVVDMDDNPIATATVEHESPAIEVVPLAGIGEFEALITGPMLGSNFIATAPGFAEVTHPIVEAYFETPNEIIITKGEFEYIEELEVFVIRNLYDAEGAVTGTALVTTATLHLGATQFTVVGSQGLGSFNVNDLVMIDDLLAANAAGFNERRHRVTKLDADRGYIYINLSESDSTYGGGYVNIEILEVHVVQNVYNAAGTVTGTSLVALATLHRGTDQFTAVGSQGLGSFNLDDQVRINDVLAANAAGFNERRHRISDIDADRGLIVINLSERCEDSTYGGGYTPINDLTVRVVDLSGNLIPTANLAVNRQGNLITPIVGAAGSFTVNGVYIHDVFTATSTGFQMATHRITVTDAVYGTVTITLARYDQQRPPGGGGGGNRPVDEQILTIRNIPGSVDAIDQTVTGPLRVGADLTRHLVPGTAEGWRFLGWTTIRPDLDLEGLTWYEAVEKWEEALANGLIIEPTTMPNRNLTVYAVWVEEPVMGLFSDQHEAYLLGFPDGTIRPNSTMTRAEVATIFFRLLDDDYRAQVWSQDNPFSDVTADNWFNNAVSTLTNADILEGFPDGTFRGNQAITRAEFVTMVSRFITEPSHRGGTDLFNDIDGHWAREYINVVGHYDWIRGFGDGSFRPNQNVTRAETAAIVNRMLDRQPEGLVDLLPGMVIWPDNMNTNAWFYLYIQEATNSNNFEMKADGVHKRWTELRENRDWTVLERPYSSPWDIL